MLKIHGFNKTTLLDYPGKLAATVFLGGCNFRCPFCHNASLVLNSKEAPFIEENDVIDYLIKRKNILEGVCITGGEPTLHLGLREFMIKIKALDLKVKLDTNGYRPDILKQLYKEKLIDYVAMDLKATKEKYSVATGMDEIDITRIEESIRFIIDNIEDYEFRTTIMKEIHTKDDLKKMLELIKGAKRYRLQNYRDSEDVIKKGFTSFTQEEFEELKREFEIGIA